MKSGWLVGTDYTDAKKQYIVYRLNDATQPDTQQNREVRSAVPSRDEAVGIAKKLNEEAAERFWKGRTE